MKYVLIVLGIIAFLIASVFLIGWLLPVEHTATVSENIAAPEAEVWKMVTTPEDFPVWRKNVTEVDIRSDSASSLVWTEHYANGESLGFRELSRSDSTIFVSEIIDDGLPFGGIWTIQLDGNLNTTAVTITENGKVYNALFRFFSKFVFGHESTMTEYLSYLKKANG